MKNILPILKLIHPKFNTCNGKLFIGLLPVNHHNYSTKVKKGKLNLEPSMYTTYSPFFDTKQPETKDLNKRKTTESEEYINSQINKFFRIFPFVYIPFGVYAMINIFD